MIGGNISAIIWKEKISVLDAMNVEGKKGERDEGGCARLYVSILRGALE